MAQQYTPIYKEINETPLKAYYTFVGAGFYKDTNNDKHVIFKWDDKAAWEKILYRHLYTADQRNQLHAYLQIVTRINTEHDLAKNIKDGEFSVFIINPNDSTSRIVVQYCVRNMYIYSKEIVNKCLIICAIHFKLKCMDTLEYVIKVLCDNGSHTCLDILKIIQYTTIYSVPNKQPQTGEYMYSPGDNCYTYDIDGVEYIFPVEYIALAELLSNYFDIKCTSLKTVDVIPNSLDPTSYHINNTGLSNLTGICTVISTMHLLSDMDILVQECDTYDGTEDLIMYMFKTVQEFIRDDTRCTNDHRAYSALYKSMLEHRYADNAYTQHIQTIPCVYKKILNLSADLPSMSDIAEEVSKSVIRTRLHNIASNLGRQLGRPANMLCNRIFDTHLTAFSIYELASGIIVNLIDIIDTSTKYVILYYKRKRGANMTLPIRIYSKHTDSDYVLISYVTDLAATGVGHSVYTNMKTRTRISNSSIANGPSAMHTYTSDCIDDLYEYYEKMEYYNTQSIFNAHIVLYCLDDGPSQVI